MSLVLFRPYFLSVKNNLFKREERAIGRDFGVVFLSLMMMSGIYFFIHSVVTKSIADPQIGDQIPEKLLQLTITALFFLLCISSFITGIGRLYAARDLTFLLCVPVSRFQLYLVRTIETAASASWMFIILGLPAALAYQHALHLSWLFICVAFGVSALLALIATGISSSAASIFVNIFPAHRMKELLLCTALLISAGIYIAGQKLPLAMSENTKDLKNLGLYLIQAENPTPHWLPSTWASQILAGYLGSHHQNVLLLYGLLALTAAASISWGFLVFDLMFNRGWTLITHGKRTDKAHQIKRAGIKGYTGVRFILPLPAQFRALVFKDLRVFIRDTTQSLQLLLLLGLTFIYLYNFRTLQTVAAFQPAIQEWWKVLLCITNIGLGACVVSAIATRFVFPAISIEGMSYSLLRTAPVTIDKILRYKFLIWFFPITAVAIVLIVSGAWAIGAPPNAVLSSLPIAFALSIGSVGLAIGIGAVYVKFDWDSPTEIAASFGSLVFMFLSLATLLVSIIPAGLLMVLTCAASFTAQLSHRDYLILALGSYFAVFFINIAVARKALSAGLERLRELER